MSDMGLKTLVRRTLSCVAIAAVLAGTERSAHANDDAAGTSRVADGESRPATLGTAGRHPVSPREWPLIAAAEHSARLSLHEPRVETARRATFQRRGRAYRQAQRLSAAVALGILGSLAGGVAGAAIGGLGSEDGMLQGFGVGACVGTAAGATLGVLLVK